MNTNISPKAPFLKRQFSGPIPDSAAQYTAKEWRQPNGSILLDIHIPSQCPVMLFQPKQFDNDYGLIHVYPAPSPLTGQMGLNIAVGPGVRVNYSNNAVWTGEERPRSSQPVRGASEAPSEGIRANGGESRPHRRVSGPGGAILRAPKMKPFATTRSEHSIRPAVNAINPLAVRERESAHRRSSAPTVTGVFEGNQPLTISKRPDISSSAATADDAGFLESGKSAELASTTRRVSGSEKHRRSCADRHPRSECERLGCPGS